MPNLQPIYDHIDSHQLEHLAKIQEFLRQPSVSAGDPSDMRNCAQLLRSYYQELGCVETELVETDGHPGVWAFYDAGAEKTIVNYCMYDTMPVEEDDVWASPPFEANVVDGAEIGLSDFPGVIVARGAYNSKGPYRAWLNALESIITVMGRPPVNIMFVAEGEEELGSPHLNQIIEPYLSRLKLADAVLDLEAAQNHEGKVNVSLGYKGNVYFELECSSAAWGKGASRDVHASLRPILDNPAVRLAQAITSFFEPDGISPAIDGLGEDIEPWPEDLPLIQALAQEPDFLKEFAAENDVIAWADLPRGQLTYRLFYGNNVNVNGISAGYAGPGAKTIVPHRASCKVNIRLVPNQEPEAVMAKVRAHLNKYDFSDISIKAPGSAAAGARNYAGYTWSKTSVKQEVVQAVLRTYAKQNVTVRISPHSLGSEPKHLFNREPLNLPMCLGGLGHGGRHHSPNEYFVVEGNERVRGLAGCEKSHVDILYEYTQDWPSGNPGYGT